MDKLLEAAVTQAPGMVLIVIVVLIFVRYLQKREEAETVEAENRLHTLEKIGEGCHEMQERSLKVMEANTAQLSRTELILERIEDRLNAP